MNIKNLFLTYHTFKEGTERLRKDLVNKLNEHESLEGTITLENVDSIDFCPYGFEVNRATYEGSDDGYGKVISYKDVYVFTDTEEGFKYKGRKDK
jgi:hypothetical protein